MRYLCEATAVLMEGLDIVSSSKTVNAPVFLLFSAIKGWELERWVSLSRMQSKKQLMFELCIRYTDLKTIETLRAA